MNATLSEPFPVPTNCFLCGAPLTFVRTEEEGPTYIFRCDRHGLIVCGPDGGFRLMPQ